MTTSHPQARHRSSTENHASALVASVAASTRGHRRRSAVIAASSGLLITMGLPSTAVAAPPNADEREATTASIPAVPAAPQVTGGITVASTAQLDLGLGALTVVDSSVAEKAEADRLAAERAAAERAAAERAEAQRAETQRASEAASSVLASRGSSADSSSRSASRSAGSDTGAATTGSNVASPASAPSAGGSGAISIGQRYSGTPYVYGGSAPGGFDCSGFVQYVHRQMGINLPRTAAAQASAARRINASEARPGDIVNFTGSGGVFHNGIYAGNGMMLDAPRTGKTVGMHKIWSSSIFFTRVG